MERYKGPRKDSLFGTFEEDSEYYQTIGRAPQNRLLLMAEVARLKKSGFQPQGSERIAALNVGIYLVELVEVLGKVLQQKQTELSILTSNDPKPRPKQPPPKAIQLFDQTIIEIIGEGIPDLPKKTSPNRYLAGEIKRRLNLENEPPVKRVGRRLTQLQKQGHVPWNIQPTR